ncbi:hypothetical protein GCM10027404_08990 [Arthrobacter tumbae]
MVQIRFWPPRPVHIVKDTPALTFELGQPLGDDAFAQRTGLPGVQLLLGARQLLLQLFNPFPGPVRLFGGASPWCHSR